jgi:predicted AlkP superfamily phosphohydrolase/phosphomutase
VRGLILRKAKLDITADIFIKLIHTHKPDFSAFVTFLVDHTEHHFWMYQEPNGFKDAPRKISPRLSNAVADSYMVADRVFGKILNHLGPQTVVIVLSEHGMAIEAESAEIGLWHWVLLPGQLKKLIGIDPGIPVVPVADGWLAVRPPTGQKIGVADRIRRIRVTETGLPLFRVIEHRDEIVVRLALWKKDLPGCEELGSLEIQYNGCTFRFSDIAQPVGRRRSAMHAENAVLMLAGPGIRSGVDIGTARLIDIAPTLLKVAGLDALSALDGRVLDVFD